MEPAIVRGMHSSLKLEVRKGNLKKVPSIAEVKQALEGFIITWGPVSRHITVKHARVFLVRYFRLAQLLA
jgi:hypothetical protein